MHACTYLYLIIMTKNVYSTYTPLVISFPQTSLEYRSKQRLIRVCTLDGATRKVVIDGSLPALENIRAVCARIGMSFELGNNSTAMTFSLLQEFRIIKNSLSQWTKTHRNLLLNEYV